MLIEFGREFANEDLMLPLALLVAVELFAMGWRRAAWSWVGAVGSAIGLVMLAKLVASACPRVFPYGWDVRDPSAHVTASVVIYGGMVALLAAPHWRRWAGLLGGAAAGLLTGYTQFALALHTMGDLLLAGTLGIGAVWEFSLLIGSRPNLLRPPWQLLVIAGAAAWVLHQAQFSAHIDFGPISARYWPFGDCGL